MIEKQRKRDVKEAATIGAGEDSRSQGPRVEAEDCESESWNMACVRSRRLVGLEEYCSGLQC